MRPLLSVLVLLLASALLAHTAQAAYKDATSLNLVYASAAAYCKDRSISEWNCKPCQKISLRDVTHIYHKPLNLQAYVGVANFGLLDHETQQEFRNYATLHNLDFAVNATDNSKFVLVSFRGTEVVSLENWIQNLKFSKAVPLIEGNCAKCTVHQGFHENYMALKSRVFEAVRQKSSGAVAILTTGHSLGGALASLASWDLKVNQERVQAALHEAREAGELPLLNQELVARDLRFSALPIYSYTFGQPRVGNPAFVTALKGILVNNYRVVNGMDIVAHLPPMLLDFRHLPTEIWFHRTGAEQCSSSNCRVCDGSGEDPKCSNSVINLSIPDHLSYLGKSVGLMC